MVNWIFNLTLLPPVSNLNVLGHKWTLYFKWIQGKIVQNSLLELN